MPDADLYFITGADALADIFTWRDADELFSLAQFVGCTRPGFVMDADDARQDPARPGHHGRGAGAGDLARPTAGDVPMRGEPVWYLVPDGVVQYIAKHQLYPLDGSERRPRPAGIGPARPTIPSNESAS